MPFIDPISIIQDGEQVKAAIANRAINQLQNNALFLKSQIDILQSGSAIFASNVTFDSTVLLSQPVYYNTITNKFEQAQAITGKEDCVGLCYSKASATSGDVILAGRVQMDMTNAITGSVAASRYFLDAATPGKLTNVRPLSPQISVLVADADGYVVVLPHENRSIPGPAGPAGVAGATGTTGPAGPTGPTGPASYLYRQKGAEYYHFAGQFVG
jgi:hypothetical protein